MRFLARAKEAASFGTLATSLSLAVANYKPIPQLPTANTSVSNASSSSSTSTAHGAYQLLPVSFRTDTSSSAQSFKVDSSDSYTESHPVSEWGEPSVLYVPADNSSRVLKTSSTVGPGDCPVGSDYTPNGGWSNLPAPTFPSFDPVKANVYRYRQQQGVNLGGWFVQEGWMEGNFMSCANGSAEFDLISSFGLTKTGLESARAYMEQHWDTWITEADFQKMQTLGINTVRIPIGYWSVGPYFTEGSVFEPYGSIYYFSWRYIARAINWAAKYDIGVLIDLHGAYGSQNGQDHSGVSTGIIDFFTPENEQLTTNLLVWIANEISSVTNVVGIEVLNEPADRPGLWTWYTTVMDTIRNVSDYTATIPLYFNDAFNLTQGANFVAGRKDFVVQDHHSYFVYTASDTAESAADHTSDIEGSYTSQLQAESEVARRNVITGEWSCALAPTSLTNAQNPNAAQAAFCEAQMAAYAKTNAGWLFWTWTMENCASNGGWCFTEALASNFLPSTFDSWGLQTHTNKFFAALNTSKATSVMESLGGKINALPMQKTLTSFSALAQTSNMLVKQTSQSSDGANVDKEDDEEDQFDFNVKINTQGFIDMLDDDDEETNNAIAKAGLATPKDRRGLGSPASRASEHAKRATSNAQLVAFYGYNDGFKSARYFAANAQLSRMGFAIQYRADSYRARVAQGNFQSGNLAYYKAQYAAGILAAEALIASIIVAY